MIHACPASIRRTALLPFLSYLSAFTALSTDLYLPALPDMAVYFDAPVAQINLTMTLFFAFFATGTLFWGPLSDRYGRRRALIVGLALYVAASVGCAFSRNVTVLILFRCVQGFGGAAGPSVAMAVIKDVFREDERERALAWVQTFFVLAPVIAPTAGAGLLAFTSWRGVFGVQAALGIVGILGTLAMRESSRPDTTASPLRAWKRLATVMRNRRFRRLLWTFTPLTIPGLAYIATSSFIYISRFGLNKFAFGIYFAANALLSLLGPWMYIVLVRRFRRNTLVTAGLLTVGVCGLLLLAFGGISPLIFLLALLPGTLANGFLRPPGTAMMLAQHDGDTGAVASLISFSAMIGGSIGILLVSLEWGDTVMALGALYLLTGLVCVALWLRFLALVARGTDEILSQQG